MTDPGMIQVRDDIRALRAVMEENFTDVRHNLNDLKASTKVLDQLLERYLLERVERIEKISKLGPYALTLSDHGDE